MSYNACWENLNSSHLYTPIKEKHSLNKHACLFDDSKKKEELLNIAKYETKVIELIKNDASSSMKYLKLNICMNNNETRKQ